MSVQEWTMIITASVAFVAVIVGPLLQWLIAKRQAADNVSFKRQKWIDELREETAEFLTLMARTEELRRPNPDQTIEDQKQAFNELTSANIRAFELGIRIKLRLNPREDDHNELISIFTSLSAAMPDPPPNETDEQRKVAISKFAVERDKAISQVQVILKKEWERVKSGK